MTDRQDPEIVALSAVLRALGDLNTDEQQRVLRYAGEKLLQADLRIDLSEFYESIGQGMKAIGDAAAKLNEQGDQKVTGLDLVSVISRMYDEAINLIPDPVRS